MPIKSPGYKSYKIEGSNLSIPGWLIQHRGESVDRAVTAATNALVPADAQRNLTFRDDKNNINPVINRDKSFKLLAIVPTEVPEVGDGNSTVLDNQFKFTLLDERFIDKTKETYSEDEVGKLLRYQSYQAEGDDAPYLAKIINDYKSENPTLTTLWGVIKSARDILCNDPYNIQHSSDPNKVLLTSSTDDHVHYGKLTSAHLDPESVGNSVGQAQQHLYDEVHDDPSNKKSKVNQILSVIEVAELDNQNKPTGKTIKDLGYRYITSEHLDDMFNENWVVDLRIDANDSSLFEE